MKFISSIILLVALQMFSAKKQFLLPAFITANNNAAAVNNQANSQANALAVQAGILGNANANANSAAVNNNLINQF